MYYLKLFKLHLALKLALKKKKKTSAPLFEVHSRIKKVYIKFNSQNNVLNISLPHQ